MGKKVLNGILTLVIVASVAIGLFLGYKIFRTNQDYKRGQESLNEVYERMEEIQETAEEPAEDPKLEEVSRQPLLAVYQQLHKENEDMTGWIQIPGTRIDYPVMFTPEEPLYYQYRNFQKEKNSYGMIFIDGDCAMEEDPQNVILYGHHMRNGSMFAELENYDSRQFWQQHQTVYFDTLNEVGAWQVIAAFKRPAGDLDEDFKRMILAETEQDYQKLLDYIKAYQFYDTGIQAAWPEKLITMTTCEYTQGDGRFFVVAKYVP